MKLEDRDGRVHALLECCKCNMNGKDNINLTDTRRLFKLGSYYQQALRTIGLVEKRGGKWLWIGGAVTPDMVSDVIEVATNAQNAAFSKSEQAPTIDQREMDLTGKSDLELIKIDLAAVRERLELLIVKLGSAGGES